MVTVPPSSPGLVKTPQADFQGVVLGGGWACLAGGSWACLALSPLQGLGEWFVRIRGGGWACLALTSFTPKDPQRGLGMAMLRAKHAQLPPALTPLFGQKAIDPSVRKKWGWLDMFGRPWASRWLRAMTLNHGGGEKTGGIMYHHDFL